jgi:hypothetical protein
MTLTRRTDLPVLWSAQHQALGIQWLTHRWVVCAPNFRGVSARLQAILQSVVNLRLGAGIL